MKTDTLSRFLAKVNKTQSCWLWTGAKDRKGYGYFCMKPWLNEKGKRQNAMVSAHRASWILFRGLIPKGKGFHGTCVLHTCDNPSCVNPSHMRLGTNADNVRDMDAKGRRVNAPPLGSRHGMAILDEEKVGDIKEFLRDGVQGKQLARAFGVKQATISAIKHGRLWKHVA